MRRGPGFLPNQTTTSRSETAMCQRYEPELDVLDDEDEHGEPQADEA